MQKGVAWLQKYLKRLQDRTIGSYDEQLQVEELTVARTTLLKLLQVERRCKNCQKDEQ